MPNEPISIRLSDDVVECLKKKARYLSYEKNEDVSYVDLIREAVTKYTSSDAPLILHFNNVDMNQEIAIENSQKPDMKWLSDLDENEWMSLFGLNYNPRLSAMMQAMIIPAVELLSLPRAILSKTSSDKPCKRDVHQTAFIISRRGAVPDQIQEGETFLPVTFQIACNPQLRIDEILSKDPENLVKIANTAAVALAREETANFDGLLQYASENNQVKIKSMSLDELYLGYHALMIKSSKTPKHLIMNPTTFMLLKKEAGKYKGNWEFKTLTEDNNCVGHFCGADIRTSDRICSDNAFFLSGECGGFIKKHDIKVLIRSSPETLRSGFVIWVDIGMFAYDTSVSCVTLEKISAEPITQIGLINIDRKTKKTKKTKNKGKI